MDKTQLDDWWERAGRHIAMSRLRRVRLPYGEEPDDLLAEVYRRCLRDARRYDPRRSSRSTWVSLEVRSVAARARGKARSVARGGGVVALSTAHMPEPATPRDRAAEAAHERVMEILESPAITPAERVALEWILASDGRPFVAARENGMAYETMAYHLRNVRRRMERVEG
jgi:hypothetical protein